MLYSLKISRHKSSAPACAEGDTSVIPLLQTGTLTHPSREMQKWQKILLQPLGWGEPEMLPELPPGALQRAEHCDLNLKLCLPEDDLQAVQEWLWLSRQCPGMAELNHLWWEEGWVGKRDAWMLCLPLLSPWPLPALPQHCSSHTNSSEKEKREEIGSNGGHMNHICKTWV